MDVACSDCTGMATSAANMDGVSVATVDEGGRKIAATTAEEGCGAIAAATVDEGREAVAVVAVDEGVGYAAVVIADGGGSAAVDLDGGSESILSDRNRYVFVAIESSESVLTIAVRSNKGGTLMLVLSSDCGPLQ